MASSQSSGVWRPPSRLGWLALLPAALFVLAMVALTRADLPLDVRWPWVPSLGVDFAFHIDGLALQFIALITGIGAMVFLYASAYMAGDPRRVRMYVLLVAFMLAMLGCVSTSNLLVLFGFWELTSITSFMLVGIKHEYESSRKSAQQALLVTGGGGLVLLAGVILLGEVAGTYSIPDILASAAQWREHPWLYAALGCLFVGAFTKSAQIPFHFWLPNAMAAPTPVSAYLHSATMVKLGIYLLARLDPALSDLDVWQVPLITVGAITSTWAMVLAVRERDLKRILAWSTVSALGTLVLVIGLPGGGATTAVAAFVLAHALYKAPLFFVAGNVDLATGTRDIDKLAALAPRMPWTAAAAVLAALSMSGLPLSFGYVAKDIIKLAKSEAEVYTWVGWSGVFVGAASIAAAGVAAIRVFWHRGGRDIPPGVREVPWPMRVAPLCVAGLGIVLGLDPWLAESFIEASAVAMHRVPDSFIVDLDPDASGWQALAFTIGLGVAMLLAWDWLHAAEKRLVRTPWLSAIFWYEVLLRAIPALAGVSTRRLQHGSLTGYAMLLVGFIVVVLGASAWVFADGGWPNVDPSPLALWLPVGVACLGLVVASIAVCLAQDSFVLLLVSGLVGLSSALLFLFLGAPDVAFTQFAVEVAFVVVIAAILLRVRKIDRNTRGVDKESLLRQRVVPRALVAVAAGCLVAVLLLLAVAGPFDPSLSQYFAERSVPDAHGHNVVNVILVDFRAVDTLGEISVVAVTFLSVIPLFELLRRRGEDKR